MSKNWKGFEKAAAMDLSRILFGIVKGPNHRVDVHCPLCRADMSGAHPSCYHPGDIVPNGLWMRDGRFTAEDFKLVIECKSHNTGIKFSELMAINQKGLFFQWWKQTIRQAEELPGGIPVLIVNQRHSRYNFVITDQNKFRTQRGLVLPEYRLLIKGLPQVLTIFTMDVFERANAHYPLSYMIKDS